MDGIFNTCPTRLHRSSALQSFRTGCEADDVITLGHELASANGGCGMPGKIGTNDSAIDDVARDLVTWWSGLSAWPPSASAGPSVPIINLFDMTIACRPAMLRAMSAALSTTCRGPRGGWTRVGELRSESERRLRDLAATMVRDVFI